MSLTITLLFMLFVSFFNFLSIVNKIGEKKSNSNMNYWNWTIALMHQSKICYKYLVFCSCSQCFDCFLCWCLEIFKEKGGTQYVYYKAFFVCSSFINSFPFFEFSSWIGKKTSKLKEIIIAHKTHKKHP